MAVLIFNGGSTGWKVAVYDVRADAVPVEPALAEATAPSKTDPAIAADRALKIANVPPERLRAIGHRIVHGGPSLVRSTLVDPGVEATLRSLEPLAPSHNAMERTAIDAARTHFPGVPQIGVFDTAFHRTLPPAAFTYAGPYGWRERGIRRYGFHGTSVAYCIERAAQRLAIDACRSSFIVAHLGGGCSVTAVRDGASVATSMGFTPLDGIMMGTRSGAIDPGIFTFLARAWPGSAASFADDLDDTLNHASGLSGVSGISNDVRELDAAARAGDGRAALALEMFVDRAAAEIAAMTARLERLDAIVFTGGIGEHAAGVRARIAAKLRLLGVAFDPSANDAASDDRRFDASGPALLVVRTREEWYVARECARVLAA